MLIIYSPRYTRSNTEGFLRSIRNVRLVQSRRNTTAYSDQKAEPSQYSKYVKDTTTRREREKVEFLLYHAFDVTDKFAD